MNLVVMLIFITSLNMYLPFSFLFLGGYFSLFLNVDVSLLPIKYLGAFALPKKYSHGRLHEYKLKFEFVLRIFSNNTDATRII